jgi:hypothetical protein
MRFPKAHIFSRNNGAKAFFDLGLPKNVADFAHSRARRDGQRMAGRCKPHSLYSVVEHYGFLRNSLKVVEAFSTNQIIQFGFRQWGRMLRIQRLKAIPVI